MTQVRKMKRSRAVALTTLTAAGTLALQGCGDAADWSDGSGAEGLVFSSVSECVSAGLDQNQCESAYAQARADTLNDAPRFDSRDVCEQQFGPAGCEQRTGSEGGSFWVPLLAGFVIANAVDDLDFDRRKRKYAPLYRNRSSGTWYHGGSAYGPLARSGSGRYGFDPQALNRPVSAPRVQSRSDVASRGGFGGRASSRGGGSWGS